MRGRTKSTETKSKKTKSKRKDEVGFALSTIERLFAVITQLFLLLLSSSIDSVAVNVRFAGEFFWDVHLVHVHLLDLPVLAHLRYRKW